MGNVSLLPGRDAVTVPSNYDDERGWNGSLSTARSIGATGNAAVDGVLRGLMWATNISYSAPDALADYQSGYFIGFNTNDFSAFTAQQMLALHFGLDANTFTQAVAAKGFSVEGFTNLGITFIPGGVGTGTIRAANMDDANPTAYGYYPSNSVYGGDTFFGDNYDGTVDSYKTPDAGNYAWHTVLHELGHTLGLKHGHETTGGVAGAVPSDLDSLEYTIMTYRTYIGDNGSGYDYAFSSAPQTFMMLDIAALQAMYGADYTTNGGNTVYKWAPTSGNTVVDGQIAIDAAGNEIFATVWDGGGVDTYDVSAYGTGAYVDLRPGGFSIFDIAQLADLGGGPNGGYARGNIFNALTYQGDLRSLIENAIGGAGDDTIFGNQVANTLQGGLGKDLLFGEEGDDVLRGGGDDDIALGSTGNDTLVGGLGNNTLDGGTGDDTLDGTLGNDAAGYLNATAGITVDLQIVGVQATGGDGNDTLIAIEHVYGSNYFDTITGTSGLNFLSGERGADNLYGLGGNDTLFGGGGHDFLFGGSGDDFLNGGLGNDQLTGGALGADTFAFDAGWGADTISDFRVGGFADLLQFEVAVQTVQSGANVRITDLAGLNSVTVLNATKAQVDASIQFVSGVDDGSALHPDYLASYGLAA